MGVIVHGVMLEVELRDRRSPVEAGLNNDSSAASSSDGGEVLARGESLEIFFF